MELPHSAWSVDIKDDKVLILDETKLPEGKVYITVENYLEAAQAIANFL